MVIKSVQDQAQREQLKKRLLTLEEASFELGKTVRCLRDWIGQGKIEYVKIGKNLRIKQTTIDTIIDQATVTPTTTIQIRKRPTPTFRKKEKIA